MIKSYYFEIRTEVLMMYSNLQISFVKFQMSHMRTWMGFID